MQALILAGGLGTRLRKVANNCPKPMMQVGGSPFLEYLILQLKRYNLTEIILSIGYLGDKIREYFQNGRQWGVRILYSEEEVLLGTGGAVKLAEDFIKTDDFLVLNGDSYLDINLNELIRFHKLQKALVTLALVEVHKPDRYGLVEIDEDYRITNFREKGTVSKSSLVNGGIYIFHRKIFGFIPESNISLEKNIFPTLRGKCSYGKPHKAYFIDIGVPEEYDRVQKEFWRLRNAHSF